MDEFLEILLVVLAIVGVASNSKKKKQKAADKPKSANAEQPAAASPVNRRNVEAAVKMFTDLAELKEKASSPTPKPTQQPTAIEAALKQPAKAKKKKVSGESKTDEHGCIGGSMPHHSAEGESLKEHAQHEKDRQVRLAQEAAVSAESLRKPTAADLRRAVVMKEILDKPVSLRGRRI